MCSIFWPVVFVEFLVKLNITLTGCVALCCVLLSVLYCVNLCCVVICLLFVSVVCWLKISQFSCTFVAQFDTITRRTDNSSISLTNSTMVRPTRRLANRENPKVLVQFRLKLLWLPVLWILVSWKKIARNWVWFVRPLKITLSSVNNILGAFQYTRKCILNIFHCILQPKTGPENSGDRCSLSTLRALTRHCRLYPKS